MIGARCSYKAIRLGPNNKRAFGRPRADETKPRAEMKCFALPVLLLHHLAQRGLEHLAVIVLQQGIEIDVALRALEAGDGGEAMGVEFGVCGVRRLAHPPAAPPVLRVVLSMTYSSSRSRPAPIA